MFGEMPELGMDEAWGDAHAITLLSTEGLQCVNY